MGKKCIVCHEKAGFRIKDTSDYYCGECAEENFADLSVLIKVEEEAQKMKEYLDEKTEKKFQSDGDDDDDHDDDNTDDRHDHDDDDDDDSSKEEE